MLQLQVTAVINITSIPSGFDDVWRAVLQRHPEQPFSSADRLTAAGQLYGEWRGKRSIACVRAVVKLDGAMWLGPDAHELCDVRELSTLMVSPAGSGSSDEMARMVLLVDLPVLPCPRYCGGGGAAPRHAPVEVDVDVEQLLLRDFDHLPGSAKAHTVTR